MEATNKDFIGNDLKFLVDPQSTGFDKAVDDFEVIISRGNGKEMTFKKEDMVEDADGNFYVCFSTNDFGAGLYMMTITAHVPDADFEDGFRDEVTQIELINIKKLKK